MQVPFVRGGAEYLVDALCEQLQARGFDAEAVRIPFQYEEPEDVLTGCLNWRMLDLTRTERGPVDLVIATRFPTYVARHPNKVSYVIHQYRQAYDLYGTDHSNLQSSEAGRALRERVKAIDARVLPESRRLFAYRNSAERLRHNNQLEAEVLHHPPHNQGRFHRAADGDYVLSLGRLNRSKRVDLLLYALAAEPSLRAVVAGDGEELGALRLLARQLGLGERVSFPGRVDDATAVDLYAHAGVVFYAPVDEDYGLGPLEAGLSGKTIVTCTDSGGPLDWVEDGVSGRVVNPSASAIGPALVAVLSDVDSRRRMSEELERRARAVTWDEVIHKLTSTLPAGAPERP
ncbi:MAG: glycosyltransferase family 4 protein [Candidatus Dormibacteria bacterium]